MPSLPVWRGIFVPVLRLQKSISTRLDLQLALECCCEHVVDRGFGKDFQSMWDSLFAQNLASI